MGDPTRVGTSADWRAWMWQGTTRDDTVNQDVQFEEFNLALEPAAEGSIDGSSRVVIDGLAYEVYGPPWAVFNPRTAVVSHIQATMRRTT